MSTGSAVRAIQLFHSTLRLYSVVTLIPSWPALCSKTHGMLGYPPVTRVIRGPRTSYRSAAQIDIAESFGTMSHTADVARRRVLPQRHQVTIYRHLGPSRRCGWYLFSPTACVEEAPEDEGNGGRTACRCNLAKRANPTRSPTGSSGLCRGGHEENRGRKEAERAGTYLQILNFFPSSSFSSSAWSSTSSVLTISGLVEQRLRLLPSWLIHTRS